MKTQSSFTSLINILYIGENIDTRIVFKNAVSCLEQLCIIGDYYCLNKAVDIYNSLEAEKPHIIFVDIKKTTNDISSEIRKIKNCDSLKDCSLIVFDSDSKLKDTIGIFSEGANVFINQPYDFPRLKKAIGAIVNENRFSKSPGYMIA